MNIIETYLGVQIEESAGYYYPAFNGNVEFKTIKALKSWIRRVWVPSQRQLKAMGLLHQFNYCLLTGLIK